MEKGWASIMRIPVYRIQNVLDAFGKQIARSIDNQLENPEHTTKTCCPSFHSQATLRQTIIEQVENEVIDRVYSLTKTDSSPSGAGSSKAIPEVPLATQDTDTQVLPYCRIDAAGEKAYCLIDLSQFH